MSSSNGRVTRLEKKVRPAPKAPAVVDVRNMTETEARAAVEARAEQLPGNVILIVMDR